MTPSEFDQWLAYHGSYYPGMATWFEKMAADQRRNVMDRWRSVLAGVDLHHAKRATEELYTSDRQPHAYERHPAIVRRMAFDMNNKYREQQDTSPPAGPEDYARLREMIPWLKVGGAK